ncbi:MAG TPA: RNA polymerase sigma factor [Candidatus Paceibacterota bacterium]|nr:RNA polymerase sigma factor [Verrucomicrobiota bacterium]HRY49154.1 RNA polymerase sigma factor [Candidatus Paceibacterota bacterium]HSA00136.1 RNA polymerase sigma factor [Candidatus Paceibacterota bacterium]
MDPVDLYEILVREHEAMLLAYVLALVRDPVLAEDITQEAFVIGFRKLDTLRKKEAFASWLRTIARNLAYAELRRRQREVSWDDTLAAGMEDVFRPFDQSPAGDTWADRVRILEECFKRLPDTLREVCRLHYFEDQAIRQITELLAVGLDAVKKRLERGRDAIRKCIENRLDLT